MALDDIIDHKIPKSFIRIGNSWGSITNLTINEINDTILLDIEGVDMNIDLINISQIYNSTICLGKEINFEVYNLNVSNVEQYYLIILTDSKFVVRNMKASNIT